MKLRSKIRLAAATTLITSLSLAGHAQQSSVLDAALEARAWVQNYHIDYIMDERITEYEAPPRPENAPDDWRPEPRMLTKDRVWYGSMYEDGARSRFDYATDYNHKGAEFGADSARQETFIYDGSLAAVRKREDYYVVSRDPGNFGRPISPLNTLDQIDRNVRGEIAMGSLDVTETDVGDGIIELEIANIGGQGVTYTWGIDTAQGFTTRYARVYGPSGVLSTSVDVTQSAEIAPGIFIPIVAEMERVRGANGEGSRFYFEVHHVTMNDPNMDAGLFEIDLPPEATVYNLDLNLTVHGLTDHPPEVLAEAETIEELFYDAAEAKMQAFRDRRDAAPAAPRPEFEPMAPIPSTAWVAPAAGATLLILALTLILWIQLARHPEIK